MQLTKILQTTMATLQWTWRIGGLTLRAPHYLLQILPMIWNFPKYLQNLGRNAKFSDIAYSYSIGPRNLTTILTVTRVRDYACLYMSVCPDEFFKFSRLYLLISTLFQPFCLNGFLDSCWCNKLKALPVRYKLRFQKQNRKKYIRTFFVFFYTLTLHNVI